MDARRTLGSLALLVFMDLSMRREAANEIAQFQLRIIDILQSNMKMLKVIVLIAALMLTLEAAIHVRKGRLVDDRGGELIFHGLNVVSKVPPYHTAFNENDMQHFQELGINGIRLGVMWPGVEPKKGEFNDSYLQLMLNTVKQSAKYGIYTLVQFHQDIFSEKFCADGVPVWAIPHQISKGFPRPLQGAAFTFDQNGFPNQKDCAKHAWSEYYFSNSVAKGFGAIWNNHYGLRDLFIAYWKKVAQTFKGNQNVIAYEIMNEPWPGDQYRNPLVMVPGLSESINLQHAYDIISQEIRKIDPNHSICFEPVTYLNSFRAGFSHPPGGKKHSNHSIFCYHYYNPPTFKLKSFMKARMNDMNRLKSGGLLSQFYVINAEGEKNIAMMDECDANLQSWFGWIYPIEERKLPRYMQSQHRLHNILYDENNQVNSELIEGITRTYAPRVAGETVLQRYDTATKKFTLIYYICRDCGETTIFVSEKYIYKNGYTFDCYPIGGVSCEKEGQYYIVVKPKSIEQNSKVMITINAL